MQKLQDMEQLKIAFIADIPEQPADYLAEVTISDTPTGAVQSVREFSV